jgi:TetR/AcrR family transcriptional repressor of uid operon
MNTVRKESKADLRIRLQKERILCAAQTCFVDSGFNAASMATIAETAEMSPGLIYRYFENKNAIILAIIELQLEESRRRIRELHSSENLANRIIEYLQEPKTDGEKVMNSALYLEITAQATRDPQIAEALQRYDAMVCSELSDWLCRDEEQGGYGLPRSIASTRALMLLCMIEGVKLRGPRGPKFDRRKWRTTLDGMLQTLFAPPAPANCGYDTRQKP